MSCSMFDACVIAGLSERESWRVLKILNSPKQNDNPTSREAVHQ